MASETIKAEATVHLEAPGNQKWDATQEAQGAFLAEREAQFWPSLRQHRRAVLWSVVISTSVIMEGYDLSLMPSFFGYPRFVANYGTYFPDLDRHELTGAWQAGLVNGANVGIIIGGFINGWAANRFGYKRTMAVAMVMMASFLFVTFFSPSAPVLLVGQVLCGIPWGIFATTGPAYASEVMPLALRGHLTVFVNLCWAVGQLLAEGVLRGLLNNDSDWSYRIPWALQWIWPPILIVGCLFSPESPWWLVKQGRLEEAERNLHRLSDRTDLETKAVLAQMVHTMELERAETESSSYLQCFRGTDWRRTEVCCCTFATQMLAGAQFAYGPSYFFIQAGMTVDDAYSVSIGSKALAFVGTITSWILISYIGRRTIFVTGISTLTTILLIIGILSAASKTTASTWTQASLCLIWQLVYSLTIGPVAYAIISETSALRLRAQTVVLSRNTYNITAVWCAVLEPYLMNPTELNLQGRTAFVWAGTAAVMSVWAFLRLPECKVSSPSELTRWTRANLSTRDGHTKSLTCCLRRRFRRGSLRALLLTPMRMRRTLLLPD